MRLTKAGAKNKQDWDTKDHINAGHAPTLPPLDLAITNIRTSAANLSVSARCLKNIDERTLAAQVQTIVNTLDAITEQLKGKTV